MPFESIMFDFGASNVTVLNALNDIPEPQPVGISHANTIGLPEIASINLRISPLGLPSEPAPSRQSTITAGGCDGRFSIE